MSTSKHTGKKKVSVALALSAFEKAAKAAGLTAAAGKSAVENRYRGCIEVKNDRTRFTGSVDLDGAFKQAEGAANRWDFGLGVHAAGRPEFAVWVEPHSAASTGEVKTMLAKLAWLKIKLRQPEFKNLRVLTDACVAQGGQPYHWLASANVAIRPGSPEANMLAVHGMKSPKSRVVI
jgi:hypothetical protein